MSSLILKRARTSRSSCQWQGEDYDAIPEAVGRIRKIRKIDTSLYRWSSMRAAWAMQFFAPTLEVLERTFRLLEARVPPPIRKPWKDGFVFRYAERTIHQAIVQKLARRISGLHAIDVLLAQGLFQEQGMIQRALDEIDEDIAFLSLAVIRGELTRHHQEYLDYFYVIAGQGLFRDTVRARARHGVFSA